MANKIANDKEVRKVAGQMKRGLYNQSEDRDIHIPEEDTGVNTGSVNISSEKGHKS